MQASVESLTTLEILCLFPKPLATKLSCLVVLDSLPSQTKAQTGNAILLRSIEQQKYFRPELVFTKHSKLCSLAYITFRKYTCTRKKKKYCNQEKIDTVTNQKLSF